LEVAVERPRSLEVTGLDNDETNNIGRSLYEAMNTQETGVEQTLAGNYESQVNLMNRNET